MNAAHFSEPFLTSHSSGVHVMGRCSPHRSAQAQSSESGGRAGVITSGKQESTSAAMLDARQAAQSAPGSTHLTQVRRKSCVCALSWQPCTNSAHAGHPSLAEGRPELAAQWHPTLNGGLTPADVTLGSAKQVWWLCPTPGCPTGCQLAPTGSPRCKHPHVWLARVYQRALLGRGCPICARRMPCSCNSLAACHPQLVQQQWDWEANGTLQPADLLPSSNKKAAWRCDLHEPAVCWLASPNKRTQARRPTGCPVCARNKAKPAETT